MLDDRSGWPGSCSDSVKRYFATRIILSLMQLEPRDTPAGNLPWPVSHPLGIANRLVEVYGQFSLGGMLHFHEGIDIRSPTGEDLVAHPVDVKAIQGGTVRSLDNTNLDLDQRFVQINSGTAAVPEGWGYIHTDPVVGLAKNNLVAVSDVIGKMAPQPAVSGWPHHLHIEYGEGTDPYMLPVLFFRPTKDPLDLLTPIGDTSAPLVNAVFFRHGGDDYSGKLTPGRLTTNGNLVNQSETRTKDHRYFVAQDKVHGAVIVGSLAGTTDGNGNAAPAVRGSILSRAPRIWPAGTGSESSRSGSN